ncbi:hypothetical protein P0W64_07180 [Tsukamurella sp. 8F]|uniref:hypothetical protein n=1 Tax=unclassified Tsukamurella TaxID=2633480 RepID=UPI0023B9C663|nr:MULTISPECIES: hypothetical protein [unclassified Tsukamurella]MDF0530239.1 hypothetical protein [Tsukamurella sp. 8J]MDF0586556.1 hypothetical protein [Tsukamurella sp. 8F]
MNTRIRAIAATAFTGVALVIPAATAHAAVPARDDICGQVTANPQTCTPGATDEGGGHGDSDYSDGTSGSVEGAGDSTYSFG